MKRDILLCSWAYPPINHPTPLRWFEFVKFLAQKGWKIDVLTINPSRRNPLYDPECGNFTSENVMIHRTYPGPLDNFAEYMYAHPAPVQESGENAFSAKSPLKKILKLTKCGKLRSLLCVPDNIIEWIPFALLKSRKLLKKNTYEVIISSSYPFTSHLIGSILKRMTGRPWIGDISDPYSFNPAINFPGWRRRIDKKMEGRLMNAMDRIIVPTKEIRSAYIGHHSSISNGKISVIPYGFSEEKFIDVRPEKSSSKFRIVYTGIFRKSIRSPYNFFKALKRVDDLPIEVMIVGQMEPEYIEFVEREKLSHIVIFPGQRPHSHTLSLQSGADLLLFIGNSGALQLPGKVFEYIAAKRPILAIQNSDYDIGAKLIEEHNKGVVVKDEPDEIANIIRKLYLLWKGKTMDTQFDLDNVDEFTWRKRSEAVEELIMDVIKNR